MTDISNEEKRKIFTDGAWLLHSRYNSFTPYPETREFVEKEALRRYPDSTPEPTIVTLNDGWQYRIRNDGKVEIRPDAEIAWLNRITPPQTSLLLGRSPKSTSTIRGPMAKTKWVVCRDLDHPRAKELKNFSFCVSEDVPAGTLVVVQDGFEKYRIANITDDPQSPSPTPERSTP